QRLQRFRLALALERTAQRERAREGDRNPQDSRCAILRRLSFPDEREREDERALDCEEQRRVGDLAASDLHREVLSQDQPDRPEHRYAPRRDITARYVERS